VGQEPTRAVRARALSGASLACLACAAACVLPDDVSRLQTDVAEVKQRLDRLEAEGAEASRRLGEIAARIEAAPDAASRDELADALLRLDQLSRQVSATDDRVSEIARRVDRYSGDLAQTRELARRGATAPAAPSGPADRTAPGAGALPDPESLYNSAYADFSKGNYALAIAGFQEYQETFPDSGSADNALYWIAECQFSQGRFREALTAFDRLLQRYPDSEKAAAGNLKKGLAYLELNLIKEAVVQLRYVTTAYPDTDEARLAQDKLVSLGPG
jgi:tol-pal system protein YbgF